MSIFWSSLLGPLGVLLIGSALLLILQRRLSHGLRQNLPTGLVLLAMIGWLMLRLHPQGAGEWWLWQAPLGLETALGLQWDGWTWLAGWLLFLVALTALILPHWQERPGFTPSAFWAPMLLFASLLVISAATWATLLSAWILMLFFTGILVDTSGNAPRAWTYLLLSGLFLILTPLLNTVGSLSIILNTDTLNLQSQLMLYLAGVMVMGAYPFHLWLIPRTKRSGGHQLALNLLPALAALHLLSRFNLPLLGSFSLISLGIAGLLGSAIAAWATENEGSFRIYVIINRTTLVLLAIALSRDAGLYKNLFPMATLAIAIMLWALMPIVSQRGQFKWIRWLTLIFILGLPFTPGFIIHINLGQLATSILGFPGWMLVLLAQTLFVATIIRPNVSSQITDKARTQAQFFEDRFKWILALTLFFGLWWGIFPAALTRTAGLTPVGVYGNIFAQLSAAGLPGWATMLAPLLLGGFVAHGSTRLFTEMQTWRKQAATIAKLAWMESLLQNGLHYLALAAGFASDILDGAGQFGWVLLALVIFWFFIR